MTGFARVRRPFADGEMVVSVKSVNHRGLDVQVYAPSVADPFEVAVRNAVKTKVSRGHVEVRISLPKAVAASATVNRPLLAAYIDDFKKLAREHRLECEPDLNEAMRLPGMFEEPLSDGDAPTGADTTLLEVLSEALDRLNEFRAREGSLIAQELLTHNKQVQVAAAEMEQIRESALPAFQARLNKRLKDLLNGTPVEPQRLAQEAAILAERSDIGEEIARLKIHAGQLDALVEAGGEVGKKLDFLLQEMNRETNTILSKSGGAGEGGLKITDLALATKASIEKIREQSLNIE
jgi:uncharacterized protein (TIGR00255 family)